VPALSRDPPCPFLLRGFTFFHDSHHIFERTKGSWLHPLGLYQAHAAAEVRAQEQIQSLSLKPITIPPNGTESGYVFFPLGEYQKVQAVLGDTEAGSAITVSGNITR
jgi:hypothetical protein